jgi:cell division septation protein DedD
MASQVSSNTGPSQATPEESVIEMIRMIEPTVASTSDTLAIASTGVDKSTVEGARKPEADENDASGSDTLAVANKGPDTSAVDDTVKHEVKEKDTPGSDKQDSINISAKSPWVVNLVSLSNKADADRFSARAKSKDIQADQYAVTVKGKQYWRVHVSGFSTAAEAKFQANIIKEKLGLKDVWIKKW